MVVGTAWKGRSLIVRCVVGSIPHGGARCISVVRAFAHGAMGRRIDPSWWRARYSSVVRAFAHDAMGRRIDPSSGEPIELFLVPASAP